MSNINLETLATVARSIIKNDEVLNIDSDGVELKDARIYGIDCEEQVIRKQPMILNMMNKTVTLKKYWFFIDGVMFYSYNETIR